MRRRPLLGLPHRSGHKMVSHPTHLPCFGLSVLLVLYTENLITLVSLLDVLVWFVKSGCSTAFSQVDIL